MNRVTRSSEARRLRASKASAGTAKVWQRPLEVTTGGRGLSPRSSRTGLWPANSRCQKSNARCPSGPLTHFFCQAACSCTCIGGVDGSCPPPITCESSPSMISSDQPSITMWCAAMMSWEQRSPLSSVLFVSSQKRTRVPPRSHGSWIAVVSAAWTFSASQPATSITVTSPFHSACTRCAGVPWCSPNVVRRASCRFATAATARRSAATSTSAKRWQLKVTT
mmetsp:Transcript_27214/g.62738  ORF Transcript_27214/g.62738 Transcript_27214/m.62738 type:complete len:222 (+) Transcript_27214:1598-2263(+)